jgi:cyclase
MLHTRVIPCLLLLNQGLVKTVKFGSPTYLGDPINIVRIFNEKEVDELVLLDITATREQRGPNFKLLGDIAGEAFIPLAYGGGIRTIDAASQVFTLGFEKVVINTYAAENPSFIQAAASRFGSQSIVVSIDARKRLRGGYEVYTRGGAERTRRDPVAFALEMEQMGAGEIMITSVERDGAMQGYDLELIRDVTSAVGIPVIACGGAGGIGHFGEAVQAGAAAVAAGSLFVFQGRHRAVLISFPTVEDLGGVIG